MKMAGRPGRCRCVYAEPTATTDHEYVPGVFTVTRRLPSRRDFWICGRRSDSESRSRILCRQVVLDHLGDVPEHGWIKGRGARFARLVSLEVEYGRLLRQLATLHYLAHSGVEIQRVCCPNHLH